MNVEAEPPHRDHSPSGATGAPSRGDRVATMILWAISSLVTAWGLFLSYISAALAIDWQQKQQSGPAALILGIAIGVLALALFITSIRWSLKRMRRGDAGWTAALLCLAGLFALPLLLSVAPLLEG